MRLLVFRWVFVLGFVFLVGVGVWAIVTITRMRREQLVALAILNFLSAQAGLRRSTDKLESGAVPSVARDTGTNKAPAPSEPR